MNDFEKIITWNDATAVDDIYFDDDVLLEGTDYSITERDDGDTALM